MSNPVFPRIYCIPATDAPVVAVFRRGPSQWFHVGRWHLEQQRYDSGAWLRGRLFPRRSDLSPDGRFLCYFAHQPRATWAHGETYIAVSKLPWLSALHAFGTCGTWTRGYYFTSKRHSEDSAELPIPYGLNAISVIQFANERRRGWTESPDSPPRSPNDVWDERRNAHLQKQQPDGHHCLYMKSQGSVGGEPAAIGGLRVLYSLAAHGEVVRLEDLQWADWDRQGRLLVATRTGKLQIRDLERSQTQFEVDLSVLAPTPIPAPQWAQEW